MGFLQELWGEFKKSDNWIEIKTEKTIQFPLDQMPQNNQVGNLVEENRQLREQLQERKVKVIDIKPKLIE